jgi:hypothetical protein
MTPALWVQLIVAVVGFFGTVVAAWIGHGSRTGTRRPGRSPSSLGGWKLAAGTSFSIATVASVSFLIMHQSGRPKVQIAYPKDGQAVGGTEVISGTAQNIPQGDELFLLVNSYADHLYFPKGRLYPDSTGNWSLPNAAIGTQSDPQGSQFQIDVALAHKDAAEEFNEYWKRVDRAGLSSLPAGVTICSRVTVKRR